MANKLSFSLGITGAEQGAQQIKNVSGAIDILNAKVGKTGQKVGAFISGFPPAMQAEILKQLGGQGHPGIPTPMTAPSGGGGGVNMNRVALGIGATPFSPWVGARALSSSGLFGGGGAGGGGGIFGIGGFGGFLAAFVALSAVSHALRFAFERLKESVMQGNELFVKSAALGTSTGTLAHLQNTLTSVGLGPETAERLMAQGQFTRGIRMSPKSIEGAAMLGAGRGILSKEDLQAILNLSTQIADQWNRTLVASRLSSELAATLHQSSMVFKTFMADWNAMWESFGAVVAKKIGEPLAKAGDFILNLQNKLNINLLERLGIAKPGPTFSKFGLGPGTLAGRPESSWEKMGLIISGGVAGTDYAKQTAMNTKRIADALTGKGVGTPVPYGMPAMAPFNLP